MARKCVVVTIFSCLIALLAACGGDKKKEEWPPGLVKDFSESCSVVGDERACACALDKLQRQYSLKEFNRLEVKAQITRQYPDEVINIIADCKLEVASVRTPAGQISGAAPSRTPRASGGGDSDESKVLARVESFFDHVTKADVKGVINDLPPDVRKGCDENQIKQALALIKAFDIKLKDSKVKSITGDSAEVELTTSGTFAGQTSTSTETQTFVRVGSDWYVDTEGKTCNELLSS